MSKKKGEKSLLEVLGLHQDKKVSQLNVPDWIRRTEQTAAEEIARKGMMKEPLLPPAKGQISKVSQPAHTTNLPEKGEEKIISISNGRVNISLNQVSATVAAVVIILMIVMAFFLGKRMGTKSSVRVAPSKDLKTDIPYRPDVSKISSKRPGVVPIPRSSSNAAGEKKTNLPISTKRQKGLYYLVIQGGITSRAEAEDIRRFLYSKGINTTVERMSINKYKVKDLRGFKNLRSPETRAELARYVEQIERLGREYLRQGGRYGFRQSKTAPLPWMEKEK